MSLYKDLIDDLTQIDFIKYGLEKCDKIEQLKKYKVYLDNRIHQIIMENNSIIQLLDNINENICQKYCRNLKPHYFYLLTQFNELENNMSYAMIMELTSKNREIIKNAIQNNDFYIELLNYIYQICCCQGNQGITNIKLYYSEIENNLNEILIDYYMNVKK